MTKRNPGISVISVAPQEYRDISMRSLMRNLQDCMGLFHVQPQVTSLPCLPRHTVSPWPLQDDAWSWCGPRHTFPGRSSSTKAALALRPDPRSRRENCGHSHHFEMQ